jgi:hypothetical protein
VSRGTTKPVYPPSPQILWQEGRRIDSKAGREQVGEGVGGGILGETPHAKDLGDGDVREEKGGRETGSAGAGMWASGASAGVGAWSARESRGRVEGKAVGVATPGGSDDSCSDTFVLSEGETPLKSSTAELTLASAASPAVIRKTRSLSLSLSLSLNSVSSPCAPPLPALPPAPTPIKWLTKENILGH